MGRTVLNGAGTIIYSYTKKEKKYMGGVVKCIIKCVDFSCSSKTGIICVGHRFYIRYIWVQIQATVFSIASG